MDYAANLTFEGVMITVILIVIIGDDRDPFCLDPQDYY